MKFRVPRRDLKFAAAALARVLPRRATLPVLSHVRVVATEGRASVSATDLDVWLSITIPNATLEADGVAIVPADAFLALAKGPADDVLTFERVDVSTLRITNVVAGQPIAKDIVTLDPQEWPTEPDAITVASCDPAFLGQLRRVMPFASTDESRQILTGVYVATEKTHTQLVATDGRRLTALSIGALPVGASFVLPTARLLGWHKLETDTLLIGYAEPTGIGWFRALGPTWDIRMRTLAGTYPNWRQVIPAKPGRHQLVLRDADVAVLTKALPTFAGHDTRNASITLKRHSGGVEVVGQGDKDPSASSLILSSGTMSATCPELTLSRWYLLDALEAGFRSFAFADELGPLLSTDESGAVHVLMPQSPVRPPQEAPQPSPVKEEPVNKNEPQPSALDRVLAAYEVAKAKVKEANDALATIAVAVREALKEDKQRRTEIEGVRAGLARLQSIKV